MGEAREDASVAIEHGKEQKRGHSGSTKREQESSLCHIDGHLSPQKCGVRTEASKVQKAAPSSEETS